LVCGRKAIPNLDITAKILVVKGKMLKCSSQEKPKSNYAINATPEQALRSNRAVLPARVIAALDFGRQDRCLAVVRCRSEFACGRRAERA
jgi:hypothetical protein